MFRRLLTLTIFVAVLCGMAAADEWNKTYQVSGSPSLAITTSDGNIRVETWDQPRIEAHVITTGYKIGPSDVRVSESQGGDHVSLDVHVPDVHFNLGWNHRRVDIEIRMPKQGAVDFRTHDGKIMLANFKGEMRLKTGDGSQQIDNVDGSLDAAAGDGSIRVSGRFDHLDLHTGDGSIEARVNAGSKIASMGWSLHTGDGSVHLDLPTDFAADVEARSGDGHIHFDMPITISGSLSRNNVTGKLNGGGGVLRLRSGDGSIYVRRAMV